MGTSIAVENLAVLEDGDYDVSQAMELAGFVAASCVMSLPDAALIVLGKRNIIKNYLRTASVRVGIVADGLGACYECRLRLNPATPIESVCVDTESLSIWNKDSELLVMGKVWDGIMVLNSDRLYAGEEPRYDLVVKGVEWSGLSLVNEPVGKMLRPFVTRLTANLPTKASADLPQSI